MRCLALSRSHSTTAVFVNRTARIRMWIGGTRPGNALYVPPPVNELDACLDALERFMHEARSRLPALLKAGLLHVQFERIHPFLDGNGRIGRLLVTRRCFT